MRSSPRIVAAHAGSLNDGEAAVRPLKAFGPPLLDALGPIPYSASEHHAGSGVSEGRAQLLEGAVPVRSQRRGDSTLVAAFEACPSPMSHIIIEHVHGAATRVPVESTACTLRTRGFNVVIISQWTRRRRHGARDRLGAGHVLGAQALSGPDALCELSRGRRRRARRRGLRSQPPPSAGAQGQVGSDNVFRQNVNILPLAAIAT